PPRTSYEPATTEFYPDDDTLLPDTTLFRSGSFTQDVDHRIIPNWGAAQLMVRNRTLLNSSHQTYDLAIPGAVVGRFGGW
ncbi:DUF4311 domain-containing protein, partial [Salmonella enterica subsp. enterica serovar 1,4,[5],12:i:-]